MKKLLYLLPALFLVIGCDDDDDDDTPSGSTKTQALTQSSWKFESAGPDVDKNGVMDSDQSALVVSACARDNTFKFEANGTGTANEGVTPCPNSPGQTIPFTWAFASNETALTISGNAVLGYGGQYKIVTLTDTKLSLSKDTTLPLVGNQTLIANFIH
jgi:hypothetical protein